jgi:hypothetical protein
VLHSEHVCDQIRCTYKAREIVSGLVLLILGNREAGVLYVGFDLRSVQEDEGFGSMTPIGGR